MTDLIMTPSGVAITRQQNDEFWRAGILYHLLDPLQQRIYRWWWGLPDETRQVVAMIGRRVGKTFTFGVIANEIAIRNPGSQQHYAAPTAKAVRDFLLPNFEEIYRTAPKDMVPKYNRHDGAYHYAKGSKIIIAGCEDVKKANRLRGPFTDCAWVDEAGYNPVLGHVVRAVFLPMCHGRKGARVTSYSNAPESPAHDIIGMADRAQEQGAYFHATVYDSPRYTQEEIDAFAAECGGEETSDFQREYMARTIVDEETAVVPEWESRATEPWLLDDASFRAIPAVEASEPSLVYPPLVREVPRPAYYDTYTLIDHGFEDLLSILAFYWDFERQWLVVVGERELHRPTTDIVAEKTLELEEEAWGSYWDFGQRHHGWARKPYKRYIDAQRKTIADLHSIYDLPFNKAPTNELQSQNKRLRHLARYGKLVVDPGCPNLAAHMGAAYWNIQRTKFARPSKKPRPGERYWGHFDHVSCLQLGLNVVDRDHDPYPALPVGVSSRTHLISKHIQPRGNYMRTQADQGLEALANRLSKRRRK